MADEAKIIDLLEKILKKLDNIECSVSATASNTDDIYSIKSGVDDLYTEVKKIKGEA